MAELTLTTTLQRRGPAVAVVLSRARRVTRAFQMLRDGRTRG